MNSLDKMIGNKEVAIYGIGKFQQDVEYVFDSLHPTFYVSDEYADDTYMDKKVVRLKELKDYHKDGILLIVCRFDREKAVKELEELELRGDGVDYILADDLFQTLDFALEDKAGTRKLVLWGEKSTADGVINRTFAGYNMDTLYYMPEDGGRITKIPMERYIGREELVSNPGKYYVIIIKNTYSGVHDELTQAGWSEEEDFIFFKRLLIEQGENKPSEMMKKTVYAKSTAQPDCLRPFTHAFLEASGKMICCCVSRINKAYGEYISTDVDKIWNSNIAKVFRLSMVNKTYSFCNTDKCFILNPEAKTTDNVRMKKIPSVAKTPELIQVCIDNSCNLHCLSCRKETVVVTGERYRDIEYAAQKLENSNWLDNAKTVVMAGNGEVFFSKVYKRLLYSEVSVKRKSIQILSNGILFDENEFQKLQQCYSDITVSISVDSLERETYEKLRAGAKYDTITKNLNMLSEHRRKNEIRSFQVFVVVQMDNLYELPSFIQKCIDLKMDLILLNPIHIGGVYTEESFKDISLIKEDGTLKDEVIEVFKHPIFKAKQVSMSWFKNRLHRKIVTECAID